MIINDTGKSMSDILSDLPTFPYLSVDTEGDKDTGEMLGVSIAWNKNEGVYWSIDDPDLPRDILSKVPLVIHNSFYDMPELEEKVGVRTTLYSDTMLMARSLGLPGALEDLARYYLHMEYKLVMELVEGKKMSYETITTKGKVKVKSRKMTLRNANQEEVGRRCIQHAKCAWEVDRVFKDKAPRAYHIDISTVPVIQDMHRRGVKVDSALAREKHEEMNFHRQTLRGLGLAFGVDISSPDALSLRLQQEGLFTHLTGTGKMSTDEEALLKIRDRSRWPDITLQYRKYQKLDSTYVIPLMNVDRVYSKYALVRTGRFSSAKPNLQNIPIILRDLYLPEEGDVLWDLDLKQIEPRTMAYASSDPQMIKDVNSGNVYRPLVQDFGIGYRTAKTIWLALGYGAGIDKIIESAASFGDIITRPEAEDLQRRVFARYNVFAKWCEKQVELAISRGYAEMLDGRRRPYDDIKGDYAIVNTIIQGTASSIIKVAIRKAWDLGITLLTTVHDELVCSVREVPDVRLFEDIWDFPVLWNDGVGKNWREAKSNAG